MPQTPRFPPSPSSSVRSGPVPKRTSPRTLTASADSVRPVDVRIGVTQAPRGLNIELPHDGDREDLKAQVEAALGGATDVLWLADKRARTSASGLRRSPTWNSVRRTAIVASASEADPASPSFSIASLVWSPARVVWARPRSPRRWPTCSRHGRRMLVCEMDAKGSLVEALDVGIAPTFPPTRWSRTFHDDEHRGFAREYLRLFVKVPLLGQIGPLANTFDFVADAAPGVKEILAVGKLATRCANATTTS